MVRGMVRGNNWLHKTDTYKQEVGFMPKVAKELTALAVSKIKGDGLYAVGGVPGLYLQIIGNSRSWIFRAVISGHRKKIGLGSCVLLSLAEAREKAREFHKQIWDGLNPVEERRVAKSKARLKAAKSKTFRECTEAFIMANRAGWKKKTSRHWENSLPNYCFKILGGLSVADIDTGLVLEVLQQPVATNDGIKPLWEARTVTASKLRGMIESVLQWAKVHGLREGENPADWKILKYTLPSKSKVHKEKSYPALPYIEIGGFMSELRKRDGIPARALEFAILSAVRSGEARGARWEEIDLTARVWTIPAERMKKEKEHRIPLSDAAVKILESLPRYEGDNRVFPAEKATELSDMALLNIIARMHKKKLASDGVGWTDPKSNNRIITVHGFRSTFRDWAGETTSYPREVCEHALAHGLPDKVEAAYQRGDLFMKRKGLMADWARYCDTVQTAKCDNVVSIQNRKAV